MSGTTAACGAGIKNAERHREGTAIASTAGIHFARAKAILMGSSMLAGLVTIAPSIAQAQPVAANSVESVTVTGYAASLQKATDAKRDSTNFTDTVFADGSGKVLGGNRGGV